jgi:transcriptional regulator with XRE-family HTH domain
MSRKNIDISKIEVAKIGGRISYIRLFNNMTMEAFASKIGLTAGNISNLENHKYEPSYKVLVEICKIFEINPDWLLTGEGDHYKKEEEKSVPGGILDDDPEISELLEMTREIVKSNTNCSHSLIANIRSSHQAMISERRYQDLEDRLSKIEGNRFVIKPEQRKADRRVQNDPNKIPGGEDRRSRPDRRKKAVGGTR